MNEPPEISREDTHRINPDQRDTFLKDLEKLRTTVREDAYKRGFWFGLIVAATLFMASSFVVVFFRL